MNKLREGGFLISKIKQISGHIVFLLGQKDNVPISELAMQTAASLVEKSKLVMVG